ncbi:MAG: hypothetical protein EXS05_00915 [Planctomycetaceae bacterium]|nr:hypothetical protein [Planctomycetaceae bacterium]
MSEDEGTEGKSLVVMRQAAWLVFKVPATARVPYNVAGLLDWSALEPNLNPIAAVGPNPTADQVANVPAIAPPGALETAIELPYHLTISPNRDATWDHRLGPFTSRGRTELWHTRLWRKTAAGPAEPTHDAPALLRAIWSPDYSSGAFPDPKARDNDLFRTAMSANDRHQIVILTSAFHGYEVEINFLGLGGLHALAAGLLSGAIDRVPRGTFTFTETYVPQPFGAELLMLSPLGGWLRSRGHWNPPKRSRPIVFHPRPNFNDLLQNLAVIPRIAAGGAVVPAPAAFFEETLNLSEWIHVATQGRDHYVRIVYEGELWPFRHRAALVKVTERKFEDNGTTVGAYLIQRMFIIVREPVKQYAASARATPFRQVRLTTLVTPDIADPLSTPTPIANTGQTFWVEVTTGPSPIDRAPFMFHAVGTDVAGHDVDFTVPLMFVSLDDTDNHRPAVALGYNSPAFFDRRVALVPGQKLAFAAPDPAAATDNTRLVARKVHLVADAAGGPPPMLAALVQVPQVQELLGTDGATTIRHFAGYLSSDFDAASGVFAEIAKINPGAATAANPFAAVTADTLGVAFSSEKAGGFATPNLGISSLTRKHGPVAGKVADAVADSFDPSAFFGKGLARLFGTFDLADLLPPATLGQNAPKMVTTTKDIPGGKQVVTTLDWKPAFLEPTGRLAAGKVTEIIKNDKGTSALAIHGEIVKQLKTGGPPDPGSFTMTGTLNNFQVGVLSSVYIHFSMFSFTAKSGQKTDVTVSLDPEQPVEFRGDLAFIEELRKAIPPGLFGDGPSLDITPQGIRAGFSFALPPVSVGVFALKDVSLGAALTLPFISGKPVFDFNVSERQHPFLLAVSLFGGGGFFHLQLDTAGIKLLEAAFEFGAAAAIDIGVASGEVHIMAGIYFAMQRKENSTDLACILSGYLRLGGSLSVLGLIKVSVEFNLSFTYDSVKDKAYGRATLTVQVEVLLFSTSVELTVERAFGGTSGDPTFAELMDTPAHWGEYALAFA